METYNPQEIEPKWQKYWEENNFYKAEDFSKKKNFIPWWNFPILREKVFISDTFVAIV